MTFTTCGAEDPEHVPSEITLTKVLKRRNGKNRNAKVGKNKRCQNLERRVCEKLSKHLSKIFINADLSNVHYVSKEKEMSKGVRGPRFKTFVDKRL